MVHLSPSLSTQTDHFAAVSSLAVIWGTDATGGAVRPRRKYAAKDRPAGSSAGAPPTGEL